MIAIIGAGIGGLAAAIALRAIGIQVRVFEQAAAFKRVGAAINMTPNAGKVLDGLGLGDAIRAVGHVPAYRISRTWDTGEETSRVELGEWARERYGASPLLLHRADLLSALETAVPSDIVQLGKKLVGLSDGGDAVELAFEDGSTFVADGVIGADGIHSVVRQELFGADGPSYTGMSAYRSVVPVDQLAGADHGSFVKWWGPTPDVQIVTFLMGRGQEVFVFATVPEAEEAPESWSTGGEVEDLVSFFAGFHPDARNVIQACESTLRTALYERRPLDRWSRGNVTLLGDSCHAMTPFMAQGAAMGLEDAAVLARCTAAESDWPAAISRYERTRIGRAGKIQLGSHRNDWLREAGNPDWVYGYDAWNATLA
jgi:salicylate hydroxylase